jgi:hypothetical protein
MSSGSEPNFHAKVGGHARSTAFAEDVFGMTAVAANMDGHVFHHAQNGYAHFLEHGDALAASSRAMSCGVVTIRHPSPALFATG